MSDKLSQEEIEALLAGGQAQSSPETVEDSSAEEPSDLAPEAPAEEQAYTAEAAPPEQAYTAEAAPPEPAVDIRMVSSPEPEVKRAEFNQLSGSPASGTRNGVDLLLDVQLNISVELGRTSLHVRDILGLGPGAVVELDKHSGEPVEVMVHGKLLARGEVVLIDENFGVRITEIINKPERDNYAKVA